MASSWQKYQSRRKNNPDIRREGGRVRFLCEKQAEKTQKRPKMGFLCQNNAEKPHSIALSRELRTSLREFPQSNPNFPLRVPFCQDEARRYALQRILRGANWLHTTRWAYEARPEPLEVILRGVLWLHLGGNPSNLLFRRVVSSFLDQNRYSRIFL